MNAFTIAAYGLGAALAGGLCGLLLIALNRFVHRLPHHLAAHIIERIYTSGSDV